MGVTCAAPTEKQGSKKPKKAVAERRAKACYEKLWVERRAKGSREALIASRQEDESGSCPPSAREGFTLFRMRGGGPPPFVTQDQET